MFLFIGVQTAFAYSRCVLARVLYIGSKKVSAFRYVKVHLMATKTEFALITFSNDSNKSIVTPMSFSSLTLVIF